jgi:heterotetrameric sarcosine oxidase gamma subunit
LTQKERACVVEFLPQTSWPRRGAWADLIGRPVVAARPAGVNMTARENLAIASILAQRGGEAALSIFVKTRYGLELPITPRVVGGAAQALIWAGPGRWLLLGEQRQDRAELSKLTAISDQSDGWAALRLDGPNVRDMLAKGCMIDLHPAAFPSGAAAMTSIAHIGVHLWRMDEALGESGAIFHILVARSMTASFWSWAYTSAAEFGCNVAISH